MFVPKLIARGGRRPALACLVLVATFLLSLWAATYTGVPHPPPVAVGLLPVRSYTPGWAIPVAIALGVGGMVLAFLIYRPRTRR